MNLSLLENKTLFHINGIYNYRVMQEESNPIKDYLFEYIKNSQTIPKLIVEKKFNKIIDEVTKNCYEKIISMGDNKEESLGVLITGIIALFTNQCPHKQSKKNRTSRNRNRYHNSRH